MYYCILDQQWLNDKLDLFQIEPYQLTDSIKEFGFSSDQILESINPAIYCTCELIINQFMELTLIQDLEEQFQDDIKEQLQSSIFTNCLDSHIQFEYIFEQNKDDIRDQLIALLKQDEYYCICEDDYFLEKLEELLSEYYQLLGKAQQKDTMSIRNLNLASFHL